MIIFATTFSPILALCLCFYFISLMFYFVQKKKWNTPIRFFFFREVEIICTFIKNKNIKWNDLYYTLRKKILVKRGTKMVATKTPTYFGIVNRQPNNYSHAALIKIMKKWLWSTSTKWERINDWVVHILVHKEKKKKKAF